MLAGRDTLVGLYDLVVRNTSQNGNEVEEYGVVSNNPIGVNIQDPDYNFGTLENNVVYLDNAVNLDSQLAPVPEPEQDLGSL